MRIITDNEVREQDLYGHQLCQYNIENRLPVTQLLSSATLMQITSYSS